jgi:aldehyde oxidase
VGQIVCAVAADSYAHAQQAAKKVKIVYQDIEPMIVTVQVSSDLLSLWVNWQ